MKKLNKKGVTLIELIVSFALVATAVIYFYQTLSTVYDLYVTSRKETQEYVDNDYALRILDAKINEEPSSIANNDTSFCDTYTKVDASDSSKDYCDKIEVSEKDKYAVFNIKKGEKNLSRLIKINIPKDLTVVGEGEAEFYHYYKDKNNSFKAGNNVIIFNGSGKMSYKFDKVFEWDNSKTNSSHININFSIKHNYSETNTSVIYVFKLIDTNDNILMLDRFTKNDTEFVKREENINGTGFYNDSVEIDTINIRLSPSERSSFSGKFYVEVSLENSNPKTSLYFGVNYIEEVKH